MQKHLTKIAVFMAIIMAVSFTASAQIYIKIRPKAPAMERPVRPARGNVWIGEEWRVNNGHYEYAGGRWEAPPRRNSKWVAGHWQRNGRYGDRWVPGRWRN
jgi:hypothetical protein